ncbi:hypothetical protein BON30_21815 [Cystobacter ferrugineus]|uniref:Uncharacterized protein n=1 Tax=Cystobacter ferrugineus TaxID=83449 RepID=A0A1L9B9E6_9BACT|nr:hypothetical protein BON30_21815 [Cystobacter ferrugineus]
MIVEFCDVLIVEVAPHYVRFTHEPCECIRRLAVQILEGGEPVVAHILDEVDLTEAPLTKHLNW